MPEITKGYKGFDEGMKCRGYQFEVGKEHVCDGNPELCRTGFHFCENPLDVLDFYPLVGSEFAEVEATGKVVREDNGKKSATDKIKVTAKLDLPAFIKASVEFVWDKCWIEPKTVKAPSLMKKIGKFFSDEDNSRLAASGNGSQLAASGNGSQLAASGNGSKLAASGYGSQLAASGYDSKLAASGYDSQLAASGNGSQLAASGNGSQLEMTSEDSIAAGVGPSNIARGKKGCWIVLAEFEWNNAKCVYKPISVVSAQIDGKKLKEDVWYKNEGGKFVEVK